MCMCHLMILILFFTSVYVVVGCNSLSLFLNAIGLTFYNHMAKDNLKDKKKSSVKSFSSRSSTLTKPTASQLAKQNQPRLFGDSRYVSYRLLLVFLDSFVES